MLILLSILLIYLFYKYNQNITGGSEKQIESDFMDLLSANVDRSVNNNIKINYIINPSHYKILKQVDYYDKFITTEILLNNININDRIMNLYKNIRDTINKKVVYGIKKKDNVYRLELYIYRHILAYNNRDNDKDFLNHTLMLLSLIDNNLDINDIEIKLKLLMKKHYINIFSFDINLDNSFYNNKIHIYTYSYEVNKIKYNTYEYDFINDILILESDFFEINNYDELYDFLDKNNNINCDINSIINELKDIAPECKTINFHHKYYNNSFGLYLINNDFIYLKKFLKKYNYKEIDNYDNLFDNLNFDFVVNYKYEDCKINGTGFADFF